jgi:hypothetical protein
VRVAAELDTGLNRWVWLVKWLLAIPHYIVLFFLWIAFVMLSVVAMVAIVFTGRYPRGIFDFNVGVLRWSWRVAYYAYGALGTDRYPPFTLAEAPDFPARLTVDYPEHLSRGLALVKWWLLAIPHYLVIGFFVGGGVWFGSRATDTDWPLLGWGGGLIGLLVLVAAIVLAFTGRYPQTIFDLVLGLNRWVIRVAAYAGLMTDVYPPFRLDLGSDEPGGARWAVDSHGSPAAGTVTRSATEQQASPGPSSTWTAGRVIAVIVSCCVLLVAGGIGTAGAGVLIADQGLRDDGYVMSGEQALLTSGYAITTDSVRLEQHGPADVVPERFLGDVRVTASTMDGSDVFVGVADAGAAARYLRDVRHSTVTELRSPEDGGTRYREARGTARPTPPGDADIWVASTSGAGRQSLDWAPQAGTWVVVLMNADGSRPVRADVSVGAELPGLRTAGLLLLVLAGLGLLVGGVGLALAVHRRSPASGAAVQTSGPRP